MGRSKKRSSSEEARARPILEALQSLAREVAKQENGRKRLQKYTGLSQGGLGGLLYLGKGSPSTWINVFLCTFDLTPESVVDALSDLEARIRKASPVDPGDKRLLAWSKAVDRETRDYWLSILEHAAQLKRP